MLAGHRKAVSYVRYLNDNELVSASTDSTLRLWNIARHSVTRLFEGHLNEKNFVGLSADGEFIACGSELNEVRTMRLPTMW
jgi:E3 ubiquitin-protein ligase RFWD2